MITAAQIPKLQWDRPPWNRWSFQHVRELLPTVGISKGTGPVRPLPRAGQSLDDVAVRGLDGTPSTLAAFLDETFTDGFLVIKDGAIVDERYFNGMEESSLHLSQSVAKSFVGMRAGILVDRGVLDPHDEVTTILPELGATAYRGARIAHVLDMTSGVRFTEDYTDPYSDIGRSDVAAGWKPIPADAPATVRWPNSMFEFALTLTAADAGHGERFAYRSIETDVLAFALERLAGKPLAQLLSEEIWRPLGMEHDACMTVDPAGFALADGGLNASLRDYARFGLAILEGGRGVIPQSWIDATRTGDHAIFKAPYTTVLPDGAYRNQFWVEDRKNRNLMARGVFDQLIYIDFARKMVVVKLSSWPEFVNAAWTIATLDAVRTIGDALS